MPLCLHTHIVCILHTPESRTFSSALHALQYNVYGMKKDSALSFRVSSQLKAELEKVALNEGRSLAQVCEALLTGGLEIYKSQGSRFLLRVLSGQKKQAD